MPGIENLYKLIVDTSLFEVPSSELIDKILERYNGKNENKMLFVSTPAGKSGFFHAQYFQGPQRMNDGNNYARY